MACLQPQAYCGCPGYLSCGGSKEVDSTYENEGYEADTGRLDLADPIDEAHKCTELNLEESAYVVAQENTGNEALAKRLGPMLPLPTLLKHREPDSKTEDAAKAVPVLADLSLKEVDLSSYILSPKCVKGTDSIISTDGNEAYDAQDVRDHADRTIKSKRSVESKRTAFSRKTLCLLDGFTRKKTKTRQTLIVDRSFSHIKIYRSHSDVFASSESVPVPKQPDGCAPIFTQTLNDVTLEQVKAALFTSTSCPVTRFLREVLKGQDIAATQWQACPERPETQIRKLCYTIPVPDDVPSVVRRLLSVPDTIAGDSVWRYVEEDAKILLTQHAYTREVMYGDRMKVETTFQFEKTHPDADNVILNQWVKVIWDKPLPWTHKAVTAFVEKRGVAEATRTSFDFARILMEVARSIA